MVAPLSVHPKPVLVSAGRESQVCLPDISRLSAHLNPTFGPVGKNTRQTHRVGAREAGHHPDSALSGSRPPLIRLGFCHGYLHTWSLNASFCSAGPSYTNRHRTTIGHWSGFATLLSKDFRTSRPSTG